MSTRRLLLFAVFVLASGCGAQPPEDGGVDASTEADASPSATCGRSTDCNDGEFCNGEEVCDPGADGADVRGCVAGSHPCSSDEICDDTTDSCELDGCEMPDADRDGFNRIACGGDDCDDDDVARFAGNVEVCDAGHDEDCDPSTIGDVDADGDGFVSGACCNGDTCGADCNDLRRDVNPGASELCNNIDDDCDGSVDEEGAFCPVGTCIDRRCQATNWEWVYGSDGLDDQFGLEVDSSGNVYVGVALEGPGGDLDGDGAFESAGRYLVSVAPQGFPRWFVPAPGAVANGSLAVSADESAVIVPTATELRFYSTADGGNAGTLSVAPFGRWDIATIVDATRVGPELVIVATLEDLDGDPPLAQESAILLIRYDSARTELGRRVVELAGEHVQARAVAGSRHYLSVLGSSSAPIDLGDGALDGEFLTVLNADLTTSWSNSVDSVWSVAVSDEGRAAAVGTFYESPWTPPWTSNSYTPMNLSGAFAVSFDSDGSHLWTKVHAGPGGDFFLGADYDGREGLFVSGLFSGTLDVPPLGTRTALGSCDAFFGLFGVEDGFARDARRIEGASCEQVYDVRVDPFGSMVVLGGFGDSVTLPSGTTYPGRNWSLFLIRVSDF